MADRRASIGRRAERRAARHLRRRGLRVLARNLRVGRDEIDILARDGCTLVAVEVRYREAGLAAARKSIDGNKLRRIRRALARLVRERGLPPTTPRRIDLILITRGTRPCHLQGAGSPLV